MLRIVYNFIFNMKKMRLSLIEIARSNLSCSDQISSFLTRSDAKVENLGIPILVTLKLGASSTNVQNFRGSVDPTEPPCRCPCLW